MGNVFVGCSLVLKDYLTSSREAMFVIAFDLTTVEKIRVTSRTTHLEKKCNFFQVCWK